jgi:hypothetical protein
MVARVPQSLSPTHSIGPVAAFAALGDKAPNEPEPRLLGCLDLHEPGCVPSVRIVPPLTSVPLRKEASAKVPQWPIKFFVLDLQEGIAFPFW